MPAVTLDASAVLRQLQAVGIDPGVKLPGVGIDRVILTYQLQDLSMRANLPPFVSRGVRSQATATVGERSIAQIRTRNRSIKVWVASINVGINNVAVGIVAAADLIAITTVEQANTDGWSSLPGGLVADSFFQAGHTTAGVHTDTDWPLLRPVDVSALAGEFMNGPAITVHAGQGLVLQMPADNLPLDVSFYWLEMGP